MKPVKRSRRHLLIVSGCDPCGFNQRNEKNKNTRKLSPNVFVSSTTSATSITIIIAEGGKPKNCNQIEGSCYKIPPYKKVTTEFWSIKHVHLSRKKMYNLTICRPSSCPRLIIVGKTNFLS